MKTAWKELIRKSARFLTAGGALTLIVVLILLLGGLLDGLYLGATRALDAQSARVFVFSREANDSFFRSRVDASTREQVAAVPGVETVTGLSVVQQPVRAPELNDVLDAALFAYEAPNERVPAPPATGEAWFDRSFDDGGIRVGETVGFGSNRTEVTVAGFVDGTTFQLQGAVWMDPETWNTIVRENLPAATLGSGASQVLLVTGEAGVDADALASDIGEQVPEVSALTKQDAILGLPGLREQQSIFTAIITVTFVVAGLVVALFFALLTLERVGLFGVLKAVGTSSSSIATGLSLQAVLIALGAFVVGGVITLGLAAVIPDAIPLDLEIRRAAITIVGLIVTALIGSAISFRRVVRIDPATAVGGS
ncbi:MAG: ABC transporter permease [Actinomycetota bacterium]